MRRQFPMLCLLLALLLLAACAGQPAEPAPTEAPIPAETAPPAETAAPEGPLRVAVASDLHYISQSLTDNGPLFQEVAARGDGKLMLEIEAIAEAFTEQMIAEKPDVLILSGDISFNGAVQSHRDLAAKLRRIEEAGVQVLVQPGNHDLTEKPALRFEGEGYERVENCTAAEFQAIYADFGYAEALSFDSRSGSYVYAPWAGYRIFMLDTNSALANSFPRESLPWLEQQLQAAQDAGDRVISVSHQNLLNHNSLFRFGYEINNAQALKLLLRQYGVPLHLSGHMHIQHAAQDGITEILTEALSLYPCRYGQLLWDGEGLSYEAKSVDVAAWARSQGRTEEKLLNFEAYARESFYRHFYAQTLAGYADSGLPEETVERLARCFADTNFAFFLGEEIDREALAAELAFWQEAAGEGLEIAYLRTVLKDVSPSPLKIVLPAGKAVDEAAPIG